MAKMKAAVVTKAGADFEFRTERFPFEIPRQFRLRLPDLLQRVIDRTGLWLALVLVKVGLQLLFSFLGVN